MSARAPTQKQLDELERNGIVVGDEKARAIAASRWGTSYLTLTPKIIEQLKKGKSWVYSDGEYTTIIRFGEKGFWKHEYGRSEG